MKRNDETAGIYIHVPFCKHACSYCNFHFSTSLQLKEQFVLSLLNEIESRKNYLQGRHIQTIYFGGGTPSMLTGEETSQILEKIFTHFEVQADAEITLEANPDDLDAAKLKALKSAGINRLSIGVQSFIDRDLQWMGRVHTAGQSESCIKNAIETGFENLTIDLIYGIPGQSDQEWKMNLQKAVDFQIPHLSCYALTVEPKTELFFLIEKKQVTPVLNEQVAGQFEIMAEMLTQHDYEHYEISNFAKNKKYAKHNSAYWSGGWYLGLGPSAHSFNGVSRQWNISNNALYIKQIHAGILPFEIEVLTPQQRFNEFVMVSLRTMWGLDLSKLNTLYEGIDSTDFNSELEKYITKGDLIRLNDRIQLSKKGKLIADRIISDLFLV